MKCILVTLMMFLAATAAAVATPKDAAAKIEAAHIVPASEWRDSTKVTTPKFEGRAFIEGVGTVNLYRDNCGVFYRLRSTAKVELKKYVRPDVLAKGK